jgi:DNA-binding PadR family transcriptional regulator
LRRLLEEDWIQRYEDDNTSRGRQGYRLTSHGRRVLRQEVARMKQLTRLATLRFARREV